MNAIITLENSQPQDQRTQLLDTDLISLRAFLAIIDYGSSTAAADSIGRTQAAVSLQIARLEERLQAPLFTRNNRTVTLTPEGEVFSGYARKIIGLSDEGLSAVTTPVCAMPLRIGFAEYLVPRHLYRILGSMKKKLGKTGIMLSLGSGMEMESLLKNNELDILVTACVKKEGLRLAGDALVWIKAPDYVHDSRDETCSLVHMRPPCSYRQAAIDCLNGAGRIWKEEVNSNSIQGVFAAVTAGFGISAVPLSCVTDAFTIIRDLPELPETQISAYWNKIHPHPLTERCIDLLRAEFSSIGLRTSM